MFMAVASSSSQQSADPWDQPISSSASRRPIKTAPVVDDWEDDDLEEPETEKDNQRIWDAANAKAPNPMPAVITSAPQVLAPPAGAFEPTMRILKRPSNPNSKSPTPPPSSSSSETLKDREARYQAARERIFKEEALDGNERSPDTPNILVSRGPGDNSGTAPKGFGGQRARPPSKSTDVQAGG